MKTVLSHFVFVKLKNDFYHFFIAVIRQCTPPQEADRKAARGLKGKKKKKGFDAIFSVAP